MPFGRPRRLDAFDYAGFYRYHVRIATWNRVRHFTDGEVAGMACGRLLTCAATCEVAVNAYCFMPDHVHLLLAGRCPDARLRMFVGAWKQNTRYAFTRMRTGARLWQPSYFERVLRDFEGNETVARSSRILFARGSSGGLGSTHTLGALGRSVTCRAEALPTCLSRVAGAPLPITLRTCSTCRAEALPHVLVPVAGPTTYHAENLLHVQG
jgi:putative transposase